MKATLNKDEYFLDSIQFIVIADVTGTVQDLFHIKLKL